MSCEGLSPAQVNGDLLFKDGEQGRLISNNVITPEQFEGTVTHDPNLSQPYVDSVNVGYEIGVGPDFSFGITGIYKKSGNLYARIDPSRPFPDAYDQVTVINPVDNQPLNIFIEKAEFGPVPTASRLGNDDRAERTYKGVEFTVRRRFRDGWQFYGSYTLGESNGTLGTHFNDSFALDVRDPNALINAEGPLSLDSRHLIKLNFSWVAPYEITIGAAYRGQSGVPANGLIGSRMPGATFFQFQRGVHYPEFDSSGVRYRLSRADVSVEPRGTHRVDFQSIFNVRVEKFFVLKENTRLGVVFDVLNLLNSSAVTHVQTQRFGLTNFLDPEAIVAPRRARFGFRFQF
jgi:hypothetical protein